MGTHPVLYNTVWKSIVECSVSQSVLILLLRSEFFKIVISFTVVT